MTPEVHTQANIYDWEQEYVPYDWEESDRPSLPDVDAKTVGVAAELPEDSLPQVSFDIRLGRKNKLVDFDYDALFQKAGEFGMTPEQIRMLNISFKANSLSPIRGLYNRKAKSIQTVMWLNPNKIFVHELKHAADDVEGKLGHVAVTVIGNVANLAALPASTIQIGSLIVGAESVTNFSSKVVYGCLGGAVSCYYLRPHEIRARRAARNSNTEIVTFTSK